MAVRIDVLELIPEEATRFISGQLLDHEGAGIGASALSTFTGTLYNLATGTVINSRDVQDLLNANGCTIDASGNFELELTPADNVIVDTTVTKETHILLLEWAWSGPNGTRQEKQEIRLRVVNLLKVPTPAP